jgi:orotate phosphoribosyltransferase
LDTASDVATTLFHSGCLKFGTFKIKSGASSPYYIDMAGLLSSPQDFRCLTDIAANEVRRLIASERIDKLASIELKGALLLPSIASKTNLPCVIVRKETKTYGATGRTAGAQIVEGDHILFFDDVVSEGLSKIEGIRPLQEQGARVESIMVVVDREQGGRENLERAGYKVYSLAKISELAKCLLQAEYISKKQADIVMDYVSKPC